MDEKIIIKELAFIAQKQVDIAYNNALLVDEILEDYTEQMSKLTNVKKDDIKRRILDKYEQRKLIHKAEQLNPDYFL